MNPGDTIYPFASISSAIFFLETFSFGDKTATILPLLRKGVDIIIIGSGMDGLGGKGFPDESNFFKYNPFFKRGTQVIILKNSEACELFNRLKRENKNVLFILHNTC